MFGNFVQTDSDKSRDVHNALNSSRQKVVEENRNRLSHIIRTIEFCGRQEIPQRGHRDASAFSLNETDCNDRVFKAALRLRVEAADKQTSDLCLKQWSSTFFVKSPPYMHFAWKSPPSYNFSENSILFWK